MKVLRKDKVTDILPSDLNKKVILLDIDNTLAKQDDNTPIEKTVEWTKKMSESGFSLIIVSNNHEERVSKFSAQYDLPFIFEAKKPLPIGFNKAKAYFNAKTSDCIVIGDQIFTDMLGCVLAGMDMVLLEPIEEEKTFWLKFKRKLDNIARKLIFG